MAKLSNTQHDQLMWYIIRAEGEGSYYGNKAQFDKRHEAIIKWVEDKDDE